MSCLLSPQFLLLSVMLKRDRMKERGAIFGCMLEHGAHSWAAGRFRDGSLKLKLQSASIIPTADKSRTTAVIDIVAELFSIPDHRCSPRLDDLTHKKEFSEGNL